MVLMQLVPATELSGFHSVLKFWLRVNLVKTEVRMRFLSGESLTCTDPRSVSRVDVRLRCCCCRATTSPPSPLNCRV